MNQINLDKGMLDRVTGKHNGKMSLLGGSAGEISALALFDHENNSAWDFSGLAGEELEEAQAEPTGLDWSQCVAAFNEHHVEQLAAWRGYSLEFCQWLRLNSVIGMHDGKTAFPVFDEHQQHVVACHYRVASGDWYYYPTGQQTTTPLVLGNRGARDVWAFESQWDAFAVLDRLGWHTEDNDLRDSVVVVITRGAGNGKMITGLCGPDSRVLAFMQNDPIDAKGGSPATRWLAGLIRHAGCPVFTVTIPGEFKDANEWTKGGATASDILAAIDIRETQSAPDAVPAEDAFIVLPGHDVSITECAEKLFSRIAKEETLFSRNGTVMEVVNLKGQMNLQKVGAQSFRSRIEEHGQCVSWRSGNKGAMVLKPTTPSEDTAKALLGARAVQLLPPINAVVNAPVLLNDDGRCRIVERGYDKASGMMVAGGGVSARIPLADAIQSIKDLVAEFDFQTPADRSRTLATLITPALKFGGHLSGRIPINVCEADQSQSGKTYLFQCTSAIYNEVPSMITQKKGGVGSDDETFNSALVRGRPFILFDNRRDEFESAHLEAFATATGLFAARVPYEGTVWVDPSMFIVSLTSNGIVTTRDFANRASIVRIRKREKYQFKKYPEGDLFAHVVANQPHYLGCIFSIAIAWLEAGKKRTEEVRHTFREWAQSLDWIVRNVLKEAPLIDNHEEAQKRFSNQSLSLVRKIGLAVTDAGLLTVPLSCSEIYDCVTEKNIEIPMIGRADRETGARAIGSELGKLFKKPGVEGWIETDGFEILQTIGSVPRNDNKGTFAQKRYAFDLSNSGETPAPGQAENELFPQQAQQPQ